MSELPEQRSSNTLLPCPFCGGKAGIHRSHDADGMLWVGVRCQGCGAASTQDWCSPGNDCPIFYEGIRNSWNRRPDHEPAGGLTAPMCPECGWVGDFRTSPPPKDPREERLREAFLKCRQMLATQTGTFYNAAHFGLTPEDIGMERASVTKDAAQPMHGGALVAPGRCDNGECWCHGGISAETSAAPGDDLPQKLRAMRDVPADKLHRSFDAAAKNRGGK